MNKENKQLTNVKLNKKEMAFLELVCVSNGLPYPTNNDELISVLESKIPIGVSMVVLKQYYEQEIVRMQILLRAYNFFDLQQKGQRIIKADFRKRHGLDNKDGRKKSIIILCNMCEEVINGAAGEDYFNYNDSEDGLLVFCRSCDWEYNAPPSL